MVLSTTGRYVVALSACVASGLLNILFLSDAAYAWYSQVAKPPFTPSATVFGSLWLVLYVLMGVAFGAVWNKNDVWHAWNGLFVVSVAFNVAWAMFFFGLHSLFIGMIDIATLAVLLILLTLYAHEIDKRASLLLFPYLAWVLFALYLNVGVWLMS